MKEKARIAKMASRKEDVFGPEPAEQPVRTARDETKCDDKEQDLAPTKAIFEPILKQLQPTRQFMGTQSLEEQTAAWLPCISAIEPSRSFEDLTRLLGVQTEDQEAETIFSKYFSSFWNEEKEDVSETRSVTSRLSRPSSSSSIFTIDNGALNYASGYSGHSGLNSTRYGNRQQKRRVRMMSHY
jgi:hypothetical protein